MTREIRNFAEKISISESFLASNPLVSEGTGMLRPSGPKIPIKRVFPGLPARSVKEKK